MQLKTISLSAFDAIKSAVDAGKLVYLKTNPNYQVIKGKFNYLVLCTLNNDCAGLHGNSAGEGLVYKTYSIDRPNSFEWESGKGNNFTLQKGGTLMNVRAFKNGNMHIKFDQSFMRRLNAGDC